VYKADHTLFTAPNLKTPVTVPPFPHIFSWLEERQFYITILHSLPTLQSPCKYTKKLYFSWMSSGSVSSKQSSVPVRLLPGCFRQTKHWCWCQNLGSHILAFLNSVRLPSWIYELIFMQVHKLKVMKPSTQVWHHNTDTPRGRLSSSHAFRSVSFACDVGIPWQGTRLFAGKN